MESRTRAREVDTKGTDYCYDNEKKYTFGLMRKENNLAERATNEHVWNAEHICTMSFAAGGRGGVVVRALASHQCGPGSISRLCVICGLSLLVLSSALRGFSRLLRFSPLTKKNQHLI